MMRRYVDEPQPEHPRDVRLCYWVRDNVLHFRIGHAGHARHAITGSNPLVEDTIESALRRLTSTFQPTSIEKL